MMQPVEDVLKGIVGGDIAAHITELQGAGKAILSQYSIGIPEVFENGPAQLPITVLDHSGQTRLHLGNLAVVVRRGTIDEEDMEFVWYNEPQAYEGRGHEFYGYVPEEIDTVNSGLDTITNVLNAVNSALNSSAADRLIANATSRRPVIETESGDVRVTRTGGRRVVRSGSRDWRDRRVSVSADGRSQVRRAPRGGGSRRIDVEQLPVRESRALTRDSGQTDPRSIAPGDATLKKDMEKYMASTRAPLWYRTNKSSKTRDKLRKWVVGQYIAACKNADAHITTEQFIAMLEPKMINGGMLKPYCTHYSRFIPAAFDQDSRLLCDKESCNKWGENHGNCEKLNLKLSEDF